MLPLLDNSSGEISWCLQLSGGEGSEPSAQGIGSIHHKNPTPVTQASSIHDALGILVFLSEYPRSWPDMSPVLAVRKHLRCRNQFEQSLLGWSSTLLKRSPLHKRRATTWACSAQCCRGKSPGSVEQCGTLGKAQTKRYFMLWPAWQHWVAGLALRTTGELQKWKQREMGISASGFLNFFATVHLGNGFTSYVFTSASPQIIAHLG